MDHKQRMHWSVIAEDSIGLVAGFFVIILYAMKEFFEDFVKSGWSIQTARELLEGSKVSPWLIIAGIVIAWALIIIAQYLRWRNTYIYFDENSLVFEKGRVVKRKTTIKTETIAAIQMKKNLFQRLMGTSQLKFDLNATDAEVSKIRIVLKDERAHAYRDYALKKTEVSTNHVEMEDQHRKYSLVNFDTEAVLRHYLLNINLLTVLFALAFYGFAAWSAIRDEDFLKNASLFFFSLFVVIPLIYRSIKSFFALGNFMVYRRENTIVLTYGTFTRSVYELPIERINAVKIKQSLQARLCKQYCIEVVNAGLGDDENERTILSLYVNEAKMKCLMAELLPEFSIQQEEMRQPLQAYWIYSIPCIVWLIGFGLASLYVDLWIVGLIALLIAISFVLQMRSKTFQAERDRLFIGSGIFTKIRTIVLVDRIQKVKIEQTWIARYLGLGSLSVTVIGSLLDTVMTTGYFPLAVVETFADDVTLYGEQDNERQGGL